MVITKIEYIQSNKYLRKGMSNLDEKDLQYLKDIAEGKIDPKNEWIYLKQLFFHMTKWFNLWEMRWLMKAFKVLQTLPG